MYHLVRPRLWSRVAARIHQEVRVVQRIEVSAGSVADPGLSWLYRRALARFIADAAQRPAAHADRGPSRT
jgi:hypothetical protein